ncbi:hypothetical protein [Pseudalkalibacillus berkeleyi]|uniref:Uncharacterized protein n=1 Tax=Pseudalkalibacillus berkeleyi TaxID=1069813 RepID=A0ABS9H0J1_9BACL|nr:hypothetical protein [Pseudalkalibacillus berkeleyi]MCF6137429.1 hypothetical protein [Pseudalkalibacillus berkeleyi]
MHQHYYTVMRMLGYWPEPQRQSGYELIQKYGMPDEYTTSALIWYHRGPWNNIKLYRVSVPHDFPTPHKDFLQQTISYKIPIEFYDELAEFDGSIYPDRTKGEVAVKCHNEPMNILTLNLVHDIVTNKRSVEEARTFYGQTAEAFNQGDQSSPYVQRLLFPKQTNTADPDVAII